MKLLKYATLIGAVCAAFAMQPAKADFTSILDNPGGTGLTPPFGTVDVSLSGQTATITFTSNTAGGYFFIDSGAADVQVNAATFTEAIVTDAAFDKFEFGKNINGFGTFNLIVRNNDGTGSQVDTISFTVTNTSVTPWATADDVLTFNANGCDAAAHVSFNNGFVTGFVAEGPQGHAPDSGTTAMLLGTALAGLGLVRRYLKH